MIVRAHQLLPGDFLLATGETVLRTFKDALTPKGGISIVYQREGRVRQVCYKRASHLLHVQRPTTG